MAPEANFACVVVTKNRPASLSRLIHSIERQKLRPRKLIIVNDQGEPVRLQTDLKTEMVLTPRTLQSGRSRNLGVAKARAEWICLLDDDVELEGQDFFNKLFARAEPNVSLIFPRKIDHYGKKTYEFSYVKQSWTGELRQIPFEALNKQRQVLGPMVCLVRREVFMALGGYDHIYGWGRGHSFREESDFQLRLQAAGGQVSVEPSATVHHHVQKAGGHGPNEHRRVFWIAHNQVVFTARFSIWWPFKSLIFAALELPRYAWGNGRLLTYPAGLLGTGAGLFSVFLDRLGHRRSKRTASAT